MWRYDFLIAPEKIKYIGLERIGGTKPATNTSFTKKLPKNGRSVATWRTKNGGQHDGA
jgi:hypothetical protein